MLAALPDLVRRASGGLALIALALAVHPSSVETSQPSTQGSESEIRRMLDDWPSLRRVADVLDAAGASGNPALIPPLKEAVEVLANDPKRAESVSGPLEALWRLGVEREYFVDKVQRYKESRRVAEYCVRLLARQPDPDFMRTLEQIGIEDRMTPSSPMGWAIGVYRESLQAAQAYDRLANLEARLDFLVQRVSLWHPIGGDPPKHVIFADAPEVGWARPRLLELSGQHPEAAAQAVLRAQLFADWGPDYVALWRRSASQFLSNGARKRFEELSGGSAPATGPGELGADKVSG